MHDVGDSKYKPDDPSYGVSVVSEFLTRLSVSQAVIDGVAFILNNISFSKEVTHSSSLQTTYINELSIVQDADRLDALGAIGFTFKIYLSVPSIPFLFVFLGIARCFAFGGSRGRPLFDSNYGTLLSLQQPACSQLQDSSQQLLSLLSVLEDCSDPAKVSDLIGAPRVTPKTGTSFQHFFDKILHIPSMMKTEYGKKIALQRHKFLIEYLKQFLVEWQAREVSL